MKKIALALLLAYAAAPAFADDNIIVRVRAIDVSPQTSFDNSGVVPGLSASAKDSWAPELDLTYMFTPNIGAELILGTTRHTVTTNLFGDVGHVSVLPPTVTAQYHFMPDSVFQPYVGAGINYTHFYDIGLSVPNVSALNVKKDSFGPALQVGADYYVTKKWFVNGDIKKIWLETDVHATDLGNANLGKLHLDPLVIGVGVGTRF